MGLNQGFIVAWRKREWNGMEFVFNSLVQVWKLFSSSTDPFLCLLGSRTRLILNDIFHLLDVVQLMMFELAVYLAGGLACGGNWEGSRH